MRAGAYVKERAVRAAVVGAVCAVKSQGIEG